MSTPEPFESRAAQAGRAAGDFADGLPVPIAPGSVRARSRFRGGRRLVVLAAAVAVIAPVGFAALPERDEGTVTAVPSSSPPAELAAVGQPASAADCSRPTTDPPAGPAEHVPDGTRIDYEQVPVASGPHWVRAVQNPLEFYPPGTRPPIESLVHNLEHGYTIVWYDPAISAEQQRELEIIGLLARRVPESGARVIVAPWDQSYGAFPAGKHVGLTHWGARAGHRQLCGKVSGEVVLSFIKAFPVTDTPEPPVTAGG